MNTEEFKLWVVLILQVLLILERVLERGLTVDCGHHNCISCQSGEQEKKKPKLTESGEIRIADMIIERTSKEIPPSLESSDYSLE